MAKPLLRSAALGWLACVSVHAAEAPPGGDSAAPVIEYKTLTPAEAKEAIVVAPPSPPSPSSRPDFSQDIGMTETYYIPACQMGMQGGKYRASWREISDFHARNRVAWLSDHDRYGAPDWYAQPGSRAPEPDNRPDAAGHAAAGRLASSGPRAPGCAYPFGAPQRGWSDNHATPIPAWKSGRSRRQARYVPPSTPTS